jgi:cell division protein FtsB
MQIKDGDYFSYSWKVGLGPSTDPYWCRDRRCVARADRFGDIVLIDTFNYWPFKDSQKEENIFTHEGLSREYSKYVNTESFDLEFICNLNDYEFVHEYAKDDYEGVINVSYQCTKQWVKPKGSEVSKAAVLKKLIAQRSEAQDEKDYLERKIERLDREIDKLYKE